MQEVALYGHLWVKLVQTLTSSDLQGNPDINIKLEEEKRKHKGTFAGGFYGSGLEVTHYLSSHPLASTQSHGYV